LAEESARCPFLAPEPSRALAAFLAGLHTLAFLAAFLNPLSAEIQLAIAAAVLLSAWLNLKSWRNPTIIALRQSPDGGWLIYPADDIETEVLLLGSSMANPWFVLMHLRAEKRRLNLLLCRDSLPADGFRRLRVALQVGGKQWLNP
jgi:hypothetical protein